MPYPKIPIIIPVFYIRILNILRRMMYLCNNKLVSYW
jgi:hypothetical protein